MKKMTLTVCTGFILMASSAYGNTKGAGSTFSVQYAGGSLGLKQNRGVKAIVAGDAVIFIQHRRRVFVPVQNISGISCANGVHRRFGAAVLGRVPLMDLEKVQTHFVGVSWVDQTRKSPNHGQLVLRLSAGDYRKFVATLERLTGEKVVDTQKTPTVVRYD